MVGKPLPTEPKKYYEVSLSSDCGSPGNAMHELGHVLGFFHEHQREDRDQFITINEGAIKDGERAKGAYKKMPGYFNSLGVGYDYASVMHYSQNAFAKKGHHAFTIKKQLPECLPEVGQRKSISSKDIQQISKLYKCPGRYLYISR